MSKNGKRSLIARGKGYLNATGPQSRFIIFLLIILFLYTFLLKIFQKLAEIVEFPIFFPISLLTLLIFIGIVGTVYSHKFVGPMFRIRKAIEQLAEGDTAVSIRLRESDDPMLKELVAAIGRLCVHDRNSHELVQETARDLFGELSSLQERVRQGAEKTELQKHMDGVQKKQELLDKAIKSYKKA